MPVEISLTEDVRRFEQGLNQLERQQLPFALAGALTATARDEKDAARNEMERVFDRPKLFTVNSVFAKPATKRDLAASVRFREFAGKGTAAGKYLKPQVFGGSRDAKRSEVLLRRRGLLAPDEFMVPGPGARLDSYGNITGAMMQRISSALGSQADASHKVTEKS